MSARDFLPDTLLTCDEGAARLRENGYKYAGEALAAGIAGPRFISHKGEMLFRWGDLALWAAERREEQNLGNSLAMFEDPGEVWGKSFDDCAEAQGIKPEPWIGAGESSAAAVTVAQ